MNKNYRVIWSAVRQCFVVASEAARARGKSSSSKAVVAAALAALFVAPAAQAIELSGPETTTQYYSDENVTVTSAGSISVTNGDYYAAAVGSPYGSTFTNNGRLSVDGTWASALYFYGDVSASGAVLNNNTINAYASSNEGIYANGIYVSGALSGSIDNKGTIAAGADDAYFGSAEGIYVGQVSGGSISNSGSIDVAVGVGEDAPTVVNASAYGINVANSLDGKINNSGTISVSSEAQYDAYAYGINVGYHSDMQDVRIIEQPMGLAENALITNSNTITATASASGDSASAYGIVSWGDLASGAAIVNRGTITAQASAYDEAYAYGIQVGDYSYTTDGSWSWVSRDLGANASITNSGTITARAIASDSSASAYGILVTGSLGEGASITNSGTINAYAEASSSDAYAYGINVGGSLGEGASITNSGTISAGANVYSSSDASAYGIRVGGSLQAGASITNSGVITANAFASSDTVYAYGIAVSGSLMGASVTNSGTINARAQASDSYAYAYGISVGGSVGEDASISNKGTITADAYASYDTATAYGIAVSGSLYGTASIRNGGTITANADASDYAYAYGISVGSLLESASITNTGTINANASASDYRASAYGINVDGTLAEGASITNSGTIIAEASAFVNADAYGINVDNVGEDIYGEDANATYITNTGTITASASGEDDVNAYGVYIGSAYGSSGTVLNNSGTISATVNADGFGSAYGVKIGEDGGGAGRTLINNSGTISANSENASGEDRTYGVHLGNLSSNVINSGIISATSANEYANNYDATSIYVGEGGGGTIFNLAGGELQGRVELYSANLENDGLLNTRLGESQIWGGDYTQGATGILEIGALSTGTYGSLLQSGGSTTLEDGATIRVNLNSGHTILAGDALTGVIRNTSSDIDVQGAVNVQDNSLALNFTADTFNSGEGGQIDLTAAATGMSTVVGAVTGAGLGSGAGAGGVLDGMLQNPDQYSPEVRDFLYQLGGSGSSQEVANKVAELLPLMSGSVNSATLNTMRMLNLAINQRLDAKAGIAGGDLTFSDKHFWLKPFGSWANQDKRNGTLGYDANTYGLAFGADGQLSDANALGVAISYARTDLDSDGTRQSADVNSYQAAIYGSHKFSDATSLNYQADFGYHDNSGRRSITGVGSAKSDYDSWSGHVGASLAHTIAIDEATTFTPSIRADYSRIRAERYSEKGAGGFNLNVGSETTDELILGADGKLARSISEKATAFANLGVGYDVINERTSMTSSFAGVPGAVFATRGIDPSPWLVRGGLGIVGQATETLELSLRYDFEVRNDFDNQTASVKARWAF